MIRFHIDHFTTSDGTTVSVPEAGVVVFVGPNNAGKSQALKDLVGHVRNDPNYRGKTLTSIGTTKIGNREDALGWASANLPTHLRDGIVRSLVEGWGEVGPNDFADQWVNGRNELGVLTDAFLLYADGTTRLTTGAAQPNLDVRHTFAVHPIQRAYRDPGLEREFSAISQGAFGLQTVVDRYAGGVIPLRFGLRPEFAHTDGVPSLAYLERLAQLPTLEEQGDGVKSFVGLMIQLIAGKHAAILVDEPEAFLHPPQARQLGRLLAQRATDQQVFLATHSAAILQGVLEAGAPVTIVRLTREGEVNRAAVLEDDALAKLWSDPLLRYSNVLDGLFYDAVVLCESDSDCRYYASVRDGLFPEDPDHGRRVELLFAQCGGKARLPMVVRALRAVQVPVVVVADFDLLREEADVERAVDALGGQWSTLSTLHGTLATNLSSEGKPLRKTSTRDALCQELDRCKEVLSPGDVEALRAILKMESGWDKVKRGGLASVPQGDVSAAAHSLVNDLKTLGLLVVPVGELERFAPTVPGHGPAWVNEVLAQRLHLSPGPEARAFVTNIERIAREKSGRPGIDDSSDVR